MPSYLITGTSRGLGLAFTAELLNDKRNTVIATARDIGGAFKLHALQNEHQGRLHLVQMDVTNVDSITNAAKEVEKILPNGLDHLISSAGISTDPLSTFDNLDLKLAFEEMQFAVTGTVQVLTGFLPLISKSSIKKVLVLSSIFASVELAAGLPLAIGYSMARASLNIAVRKWSGVLKKDGITIALIHPGYVGSTDMGSAILDFVTTNVPNMENLTPQKSAADVIKVLNQLKAEDNGAFFNHDGTKLPF